MDGPRDYHIKSNKNNHITYMWNLKKNATSELMHKNRNRVTEFEDKFTAPKGERSRWGRNKLGVWD